MKLIVGLGNPGSPYKNTRHNLGFMALEALADELGAKFRKDPRSNSLKAELDFSRTKVILCKPLTYMNISGEAVSRLAHLNKVKPEDILVICDDISLELGSLKVRAQGGSGGHHGLGSIIKDMRTESFSRLRIGISAPEKAKRDLSAYVLAPFLSREKARVKESLAKAKEIARFWLENGIEAAMNRFNKNTIREKVNE